MALVASIYHLPPRVLPSIQAVEGGAAGAVHRNTDGSEDLGVMQINTIWLPALAAATGLDRAELHDRLVSLPCFNIAVAGTILRFYIDEANGDLMRAIGYYHSHTPTLSQKYQSMVMQSATRLFVQPKHSPEK